MKYSSLRAISSSSLAMSSIWLLIFREASTSSQAFLMIRARGS